MAKINRRLSGTTSFRSKTPTSPQTAENFSNMVFDHSTQKDVVPGRLFSSRDNGGGYRTMNSTGEPKALDAVVGGSHNYKGPVR